MFNDIEPHARIGDVLRRLLVITLLCSVSQGAVAGGKLKVSDVMAAMDASGPKSLPEKYFDCTQYEESVFDAIATGEAQWVAVAVKAIPASDGCAAEDIRAALGEAMQRKPENVLPLVGKTDRLAADEICLPFLSDEVPIEQSRREVRRSRRAVERTQGFDSQKAACLRVIESMEKRLAKGRSLK